MRKRVEGRHYQTIGTEPFICGRSSTVSSAQRPSDQPDYGGEGIVRRRSVISSLWRLVWVF
jgi:hypothetical protein